MAPPSKRDDVREYVQQNPGYSGLAIAEATGLAGSTVLRWLQIMEGVDVHRIGTGRGTRWYPGPKRRNRSTSSRTLQQYYDRLENSISRMEFALKGAKRLLQSMAADLDKDTDMPKNVVNVTCTCGKKYRTKLSKGKHTKSCPECGKQNT